MYIGQWALVLGSHFLYFESQLYLLSLSDCPIYLSATTVVLPVGVRYTVSILTEVSTATGDRAPSVPLNRTTILTGTGLLTANASALYLKGALENPLLLLWILLFKRS